MSRSDRDAQLSVYFLSQFREHFFCFLICQWISFLYCQKIICLFFIDCIYDRLDCSDCIYCNKTSWIFSSFSSFGMAVISFSFSAIGSCAITRAVAVSIAFSIYGVFLFLIFSVLPRSAFPSIAMFIPFVFRIPVIHSINARQKISSSMFRGSLILLLVMRSRS